MTEDVMKFINKTEEIKVARKIIETTFSWGDLNPKYAGMSSASGNQFCMFHPNKSSPSGKFYEDTERDILVFHCFTERRTFTTYDYVTLILCEQDRMYKDVWDFLDNELGHRKVVELVTLIRQNVSIEDETLLDKKIEYINNVYNTYDNVIDYINSLYTEKD